MRQKTRIRRVHRSLSGPRFAIEPLEDRRLLSTIVWANQGTANSDSDAFQATYGANAGTARAIVREAIRDWQGVIEDFRYSNVGTEGNAPLANTYQLTIQAVANLTSDDRQLRGATSGMTFDDEGKPFSATIRLDGDFAIATGNTAWWFDSNSDNAEFTNLTTRFTADQPFGAGVDFYRTVLHEMGHAMGIVLSDRMTENFLTAAGADQLAPADDPASLYVFTGESVTTTFTDQGGLHVYDGPPDPASDFPDAPSDPNDLLNPGRAIPTNRIQRRLISDTDAWILQDAYDYEIRLPSSRETFLINYNMTSAVVDVRGDPMLLDDRMTLNVSLGGPGLLDDLIVIAVDDVATALPASAVVQVRMDGGAGNDELDILATHPRSAVTLTGGIGENQIVVGSATNSLDPIDGPVAFRNLRGRDSVVLRDDGSIGPHSYRMTSQTLSRSGMAELAFSVAPSSVELRTGRGADDLTIESTPGRQTIVNTGAGADQIHVGGAVNQLAHVGGLDLLAGPGSDTIDFIDLAAERGESYTLAESTLLRAGRAAITYAQAEFVNLLGTPDADTILVAGTAEATAYTVNGWGGNDTIQVDTVFRLPPLPNSDLPLVPPRDTLLGRLTVQGSLGRDLLEILDGENAAAATYTVTATRVARTGLAAINYGTIESLVLRAGGGNDALRVQSTATGVATSIFGGFGNDRFQVADLGNVIRNLRGRLALEGNAGEDTIDLDDQNNHAATTHVLRDGEYVHGNQQPIQYGTVESVNLNAGRGDDLLRVEGTTAGVMSLVSGGIGHDRIELGSAANVLDPIAGPLRIRGAAGRDSLQLRDQASAVARTYTITSTTLERAGGPAISYDTLENISLASGSGADWVRVLGTPGDTTIQTGSGDDTVDLGGYVVNIAYTGGSLDDIRGTVTVSGEGDRDQLWLHDWADRSDNVYEIFRDRLLRGATPIRYDASVELLRVGTGIGSETVRVRSTSDKTQVALSGKAGGVVAFNVGDATDSLDSIALPPIIVGQSPHSLRIFDQGDGDANAYVVTSSGVLRNGQSVLSYTGVGSLALLAGAGDNMVDVTGSAAGTPVTVDGGGGNDTLTGSNQRNFFFLQELDGGSLSCCGSPIAFHSFENLLGGFGDDTFVLTPQQSLTGRIIGSDGQDTLDYSAYTAGIVVNLQLGTATAVAAVSGIENVVGGAGGDILVGDQAANRLVGNAGRDLLFGGLGRDELTGGDDDDLLMGGESRFDRDAVALASIFDAWRSQNGSYADRIAQLTRGVGVDGTVRLDASTVWDDGVVDRLRGELGLDWFFASLLDDTDRDGIAGGEEQVLPELAV